MYEVLKTGIDVPEVKVLRHPMGSQTGQLRLRPVLDPVLPTAPTFRLDW